MGEMNPGGQKVSFSVVDMDGPDGLPLGGIDLALAQAIGRIPEGYQPPAPYQIPQTQPQCQVSSICMNPPQCQGLPAACQTQAQCHVAVQCQPQCQIPMQCQPPPQCQPFCRPTPSCQAMPCRPAPHCDPYPSCRLLPPCQPHSPICPVCINFSRKCNVSTPARSYCNLPSRPPPACTSLSTLCPRCPPRFRDCSLCQPQPQCRPVEVKPMVTKPKSCSMMLHDLLETKIDRILRPLLLSLVKGVPSDVEPRKAPAYSHNQAYLAVPDYVDSDSSFYIEEPTRVAVMPDVYSYQYAYNITPEQYYIDNRIPVEVEDSGVYSARPAKKHQVPETVTVPTKNIIDIEVPAGKKKKFISGKKIYNAVDRALELVDKHSDAIVRIHRGYTKEPSYYEDEEVHATGARSRRRSSRKTPADKDVLNTGFLESDNKDDAKYYSIASKKAPPERVRFNTDDSGVVPDSDDDDDDSLKNIRNEKRLNVVAIPDSKYRHQKLTPRVGEKESGNNLVDYRDDVDKYNRKKMLAIMPSVDEGTSVTNLPDDNYSSKRMNIYALSRENEGPSLTNLLAENP